MKIRDNKNVKDVAAYVLAKHMCNSEEYDELWDELYHYMDAYLSNPHSVEVIIFADLVENLIGVRKHEDILEVIFKYGNTYRSNK
jgi:hypothetical protein